MRLIIDELTELVEEAVLNELDALSERGGVLGAMELGYQRGMDAVRCCSLGQITTALFEVGGQYRRSV